MQTILTNGPVSNRLNIVVLSEGYTTNQLAQFLGGRDQRGQCALVPPALSGILELFQRLCHQGRFQPIRLHSPRSTASTNNTYFNSIYDPDSDYLITIPPNWADTNYSHGQGKVDALLQTFMPNCQLPVLLVNDHH